MGWKELSEVLSFNSTLTWLSLNFNHIEFEGCEKLSEALSLNSSLTELDLAYNRIEDEGCAKLSEASSLNSTLTELYLNYNQMMCEAIRSTLSQLIAHPDRSHEAIGLGIKDV